LISGAFLRNSWYVAAWSDGVGDGQLIARTIMNEPVVLFRQDNGEVAAIEDRCAHRFAPLHMGKIVGGDRIQCPYHGLEFDGRGVCVRNPHGAKNIPSRARVKSYPVVEKHRAVWVWMGPAPADAGKIPDFSVLDNVPELHTTKRDSIVIKANYQLIIDNLLDLSHTSYLRIAEMRRFAFEEQDAPVIEAQQQIIENAMEPLDPVTLSVDVGCVRYKRVLNNMLAAEQR
jgi:vanillate O-demethylase monooxygenase subunit